MSTPQSKRDLLYQLLIRKRNIAYRKQPDSWLTQKFKEKYQTLVWSAWDHDAYENHNWDGTKDPFFEATKALSEKNNVAIESATGCGKTYWLARLLYWFLDVYKDGIVITTAPTGQQLKDVLWAEIGDAFRPYRKISPSAEMYDLRMYPDGRVDFEEDSEDEVKTGHKAIGIVTSASAGVKSAVKFQGYHGKNMLFILEEGAGINIAVLNAIKNTCTDENNLICILGNPDSVNDTLHNAYLTPGFKKIRISALDHPNVVLNKTVIPGAVTIKSINQRKEEWGEDSEFYKSRVRGICPDNSKDSYIKYEWIVRRIKKHEKFAGHKTDYRSMNAAGVDVANSESGDKASIAYGEKNILKGIQSFNCPNANDLAYNLVKDDGWLIAHKKKVYNTVKLPDLGIMAQHVGVDAAGLGVSTVNSFQEEDLMWNVASLKGGQDKSCIPIDEERTLPNGDPIYLYEFVSLRAQMIYQLGQDLRKGEITIDIDDDDVLDAIIRQSIIVKLIASRGKVSFTTKEDMIALLTHSPDEFDALCYWNWMRKDRSIDTTGTEVPII